MAVCKSIVEYKHYGRCLKLKNDKLEVLITMDVGPRIISFTPQGGSNLFFNDDEDLRVSKGEVFESIFGEGEEYHFYGGHRLWLAPQYPLHTNVPDNRPLTVEEVENGARFIGAYSPVSGMRPTMTVVMDESKAEIAVTASYTNESDQVQHYAPWQISQLAPGGVAFVPFGLRNDAQPFGFSRERPPFRGPRPAMKLDEPLLPHKVFVLFDISHLKDDRLHLHNRYVVLEQDETLRRPFKAGLAAPEGFGLYALGDFVFKAQHTHNPNGCYTDGGSSLEIYTDAAFLEMEALGEYTEVAPGETITHTETLSVTPRTLPLPDPEDEEAIHEFVWAHA